MQREKKKKEDSKSMQREKKKKKDSKSMQREKEKSGKAINAAQQHVLVVCQADKQVTCAPAKSTKKGNTTKTSCKVHRTAVPVAVCDFNIDLWNVGGTCIA